MWKIFEWLGDIFKKGALIFMDLIKSAFPIAKQVIMSQLSSFGSQVIAELAAGNLSSEEKRAEAFNRIKARAGEVSIVITDSLVNALIEILVQKYKTEHGE
jgi:hypothetical protein